MERQGTSSQAGRYWRFHSFWNAFFWNIWNFHFFLFINFVIPPFLQKESHYRSSKNGYYFTLLSMSPVAIASCPSLFSHAVSSTCCRKEKRRRKRFLTFSSSCLVDVRRKGCAGDGLIVIKKRTFEVGTIENFCLFFIFRGKSTKCRGPKLKNFENWDTDRHAHTKIKQKSPKKAPDVQFHQLCL